MATQTDAQIMIDWLYTAGDSPVLFANERQLIAEAKHYNITRKQVHDYLRYASNTYNTHKQTHVRFRRRRIKAPLGIHTTLQLDLADMSKYARVNKWQKWILVVWDAHSRKIMAEPTLNKTPAAVLRSFRKILDRDLNGGRVITSLTHDDGNEFKGEFKEYAQSQLIEQRIAPHSPFKTAGAERSIRSIKTRLYKNMSHQKTNKWTHILQAVVDSLNQLPKKALNGRTPASMTSDTVLEKTDEVDAPHFIYRVNDRVRVRMDDATLGHKGFEARFSPDIYIVTHRVGGGDVPAYRLTTIKQQAVEGIFYHSELTHAVKQDG